MSVQTLDIRPGDTVIIYCNDFLKVEQRERAYAHYKAKFPQAGEVVIMEGGMKVAVARPGSDQLLSDIRDAIVRLADQFERVSSAGHAVVVEGSR